MKVKRKIGLKELKDIVIMDRIEYDKLIMRDINVCNKLSSIRTLFFDYNAHYFGKDELIENIDKLLF